MYIPKQTTEKQEKMKIIIDCDPGVDDMETILMALAAKHIEIVAITTCLGNTVSDQTFLNAKKILYTCGRIDIPVYHGTRVNLMGVEPVSNNYHGMDGLCDMNLEFEDVFPQQTMNSSEALIHYVNRYPGEINLVAIAPLTNVAAAYLNDNSFAEKLASLTVMGGDRNEITVNNISKHAEFNCWCDPAAWQLVMKNFKLSNNKKINLIDLAFCHRNLLRVPYLESFFNNHYADDPNNKRASLIKKASHWMSLKWTKFGDNTCDPFALFVTIYPEYEFSGKLCVVEDIHMEGDTMGHTVFKPDDNGHILLIDNLDMDNFLRILLDSIKPEINGCQC